MPPKKKAAIQKEPFDPTMAEYLAMKHNIPKPPATAKWSTAKGKKKAQPEDFDEVVPYDEYSDLMNLVQYQPKPKNWSPTSLSPVGEPGQDQPEEPEELTDSTKTSLELLRDYGSKVTARNCNICKKKLLEDFDFVRHVESWPALILPKSQQRKRSRAVQHPGSIECSSTFCTGVTCLGCGEQHAPASDDVDWCCDEGRMVAIWMLLSYLDQKYLDAETKTFASSNYNTLHSKISWHKGPGRKARLPAGVGYTNGAYDDYSDYASPDDWDSELEEENPDHPASFPIDQLTDPYSYVMKQDQLEEHLKTLQSTSEELKNQLESAIAKGKDIQKMGESSTAPNVASSKVQTKHMGNTMSWAASSSDPKVPDVHKPQGAKKTKKKSGEPTVTDEASEGLEQSMAGDQESAMRNAGFDATTMLADLQRLTQSAKSISQHQTSEEFETEWQTLNQLVSTTQQISEHLKFMEQNSAAGTARPAPPAPKHEEPSLKQDEKQPPKDDATKVSGQKVKQAAKSKGKKSLKHNGKETPAKVTKGPMNELANVLIDYGSEADLNMEIPSYKGTSASNMPYPSLQQVVPSQSPDQQTSLLPPPPPLPPGHYLASLASGFPTSTPSFPTSYLPPPPPPNLSDYVGFNSVPSHRSRKQNLTIGAFDSDRRAMIVDNEKAFLMLAKLLPDVHKVSKAKNEKRPKRERQQLGISLTPNVTTRSKGGPIVGGLGDASSSKETLAKPPSGLKMPTSNDNVMKAKPSTFDSEPPEILSTAIEYSFVLYMISRVISDDSIDRIVENKSLYLAMLQLVSMLHNHSATAQLVSKTSYMTRKGRSKGIYDLTVSSGDLTSGGRSRKETNLPLAKSLENLSVVSKSVLETAEAMKKQYKDVKGLLSLCNRIEYVSNEVNPPIKISDDKTAEEAPIDHWKEYCAENRVEMVEIDDIVRHYCYNEEKDKADAPVARGGASGGSKIKRLVHEVGSLRNSLPDGVFLKICSSRPDIMKIVIIGPLETAYAHGLYEFDLFCPNTYPYSPPLVHFKTPETIHINPNLHHSGTVCLSLLGTWGGSADESWRPGISNLFQVLVSMQSMVFCSNPIANEPGDYGVPEKHPRARQYNAAVQALNIRYGMLEWLRRMDRDKPLWTGIVRKHFEENGLKIVKLAREWSKENEFVSKYGGWKTVEEACSTARLLASASASAEGEIPGAMPVPHAPPGGRRSMWRAPAKETVDLAQQLQTEMEKFLGRKMDLDTDVKA